ncbi:MAG: ATP-binding protein [Verrucomicrobiota bacterium]
MDKQPLPFGTETSIRLLKLSGEAFCSLDREGSLLWVNSNWEHLVGTSVPSAGQAIEIDQLIHPQYRDAFREILKKALNDTTLTEPLFWNGQILGAKGEYISVDGRVGAMEENVLGVFLKDLKPERQNIEITATELAKTKAAKLAQSRFVANMSYELRTPLNDILGLCELIQKSKLDHTQAGMIRDMRESGSTLLAIFDDLSDWARLQTGEMEFLISPTCPETLLTAASRSLALSWQAREIHLQIIPTTTPFYVAADPGRLRKIIKHLLDNAITRTPNKGTVTVSLSSSGSNVSMDITDSGPAIKADEISHLLDDSYREKPASTPGFGGAGLGLAISQAMLEAMQGRISVRSETGKGCTFTVTLPAVSPTVSSKQSDIQVAVQEPSRALKVLVAEDNQINARVAVGMLEFLGHSAVVAQNGLEVQEADWRSFDVILMDVHMPLEDGLEATRKIRKAELIEARGPMPIYGITASVMSEDRDACMEAGMDGIIEKPVTLDRLIEKITKNKKAPVSTDDDVVARVRKSYGRCIAKTAFLDTFYAAFLHSSPEIEKMFRKTDLKKQKELLKHGLAILFMFARNPNATLAREKLTHIGMIHSRNRFNVKPNLYPFWISSLIDTVAIYDDQFTPKLGTEWKAALKPAIDYLISLY